MPWSGRSCGARRCSPWPSSAPRVSLRSAPDACSPAWPNAPCPTWSLSMFETRAADRLGDLAPVRADVRPAAILGLATELPAGRLTNAELAMRLRITEEWIVSRTGIRERRRAEPEERISDYATRVGAAALATAGVSAAELDLVIVATMTQDELTPNTAPIVAHAIGASRAGAFDVGAACTAFLAGL